MNWDNYECEGQINIFDFIKPDNKNQNFSWDNDINIIYDKICDLAEKFNITIANSEWKVWSHVPQFGYRMSVTLHLKKETLQDDFWNDLNSIVEYGKQKEIEISPMQPFFISADRNGCMHIFSTFMDKARRKIKSY